MSTRQELFPPEALFPFYLKTRCKTAALPPVPAQKYFQVTHRCVWCVQVNKRQERLSCSQDRRAFPDKTPRLQTGELGPLRGDTVGGGGGGVSFDSTRKFPPSRAHIHTPIPRARLGDAASPGLREETCADFRARGPAGGPAYPAAAPRAPDAKAGAPRACSHLRPPSAAAIKSAAGPRPSLPPRAPGPLRLRSGRAVQPPPARTRPRGRQGRGSGLPARRTYHGTDGGEFGDRH